MSARPDPPTETRHDRPAADHVVADDAVADDVVVDAVADDAAGDDAALDAAALDGEVVEGQVVDGQVVGGATTGGGAGDAGVTAADLADDQAVRGEVVEPDVFADAGAAAGNPVTLAAQRDEYLGALQRLQADFENYRKRVLRQQQDQSARAAVDLVGKLLPVLDTLDLAEAHLGAPAGGPTDEGKALGQARAMLIDVLSKEGLERVDRDGVTFDPVVHDAVAHAPEPAEEPTGGARSGETVVDEVLRSGYRWRNQVLRPAMVRVRG